MNFSLNKLMDPFQRGIYGGNSLNAVNIRIIITFFKDDMHAKSDRKRWCEGILASTCGLRLYSHEDQLCSFDFNAKWIDLEKFGRWKNKSYIFLWMKFK